MIYTWLLGSIYHVMTFRDNLRDDVEQIVTRIDAHLSTVEQELRQLPVLQQCDSTYMTLLRERVFNSVTLRGLIVGELQGPFPNLCSNFGLYSRHVDERDWDYSSRGDLLFGKVKFSKYRRDSSFALAVRRNDGLVIALVNPKAILGWWIGPNNKKSNITLSFTDEEAIRIERFGFSQSDSTLTYSFGLSSDVFPYQISVHRSSTEFLSQLVTFSYRLIGLFTAIYGALLGYLLMVKHRNRGDNVERSI
ncbi:hypothetical protein [Vibrio methylphosphonaticus]|uniref:hypothetical protein n=1 Tax=Vibrio methylphosphonaticus TaxID=2946866 RepID=UPI002029CE00|nr:hypothetical protein [Vibrio methylphosphonaticus]MCL9773790.1 hypothetical protein [Vibrio methylphosphonaticus]